MLARRCKKLILGGLKIIILRLFDLTGLLPLFVKHNLRPQLSQSYQQFQSYRSIPLVAFKNGYKWLRNKGSSQKLYFCYTDRRYFDYRSAHPKFLLYSFLTNQPCAQPLDYRAPPVQNQLLEFQRYYLGIRCAGTWLQSDTTSCHWPGCRSSTFLNIKIVGFIFVCMSNSLLQFCSNWTKGHKECYHPLSSSLSLSSTLPLRIGIIRNHRSI